MKRRILLVDDDRTVLLTLKAVLELNQFDVQTAASAAEAFEKLLNKAHTLADAATELQPGHGAAHRLSAAQHGLEK